MSKFEYACFLSYRNGRHEQARLNTFTKILAEEIKNAVDAYLPDSSVQDDQERIVFLDQDIFKNYDFDPKALGKGLCNSICWIVLYTRNYFGGSLWCASEYHGMLALEKKRLKKLGLKKNPDSGFIAPILLTGDHEEMPQDMRNRTRHLFDFRKLFLRKTFENDDDFTDKLTAILDNIGRVHKVALAKKTDLCHNCKDFKLVDVRTKVEMIK